jgi:hypothetical protein
VLVLYKYQIILPDMFNTFSLGVKKQNNVITKLNLF